MIWNTKQYNLTDNKITRSAHGFYLDTIALLVRINVYHPTPLEDFIGKYEDLIVQLLNLIFLTSSKIHWLCTILAQIPPLRIFIRGGENSEQKIRFEGDGDERDGNGDKYFAYIFHWWYYNPVAIFSLYLLVHAYHVEFQLVKKKSSLHVTVFILM